jgi:competence protein ComEC
MAGFPSPSSFESFSRKLHEPLVPTLVGVIGGILFAQALGFEPTVAILCAAACALLWLIAWRKHLAVASFIAGNMVMFWLAVASAAHAGAKPKPRIEMAPRELMTIEGCVDSLPQREAERLFFHLAVTHGARMRTSLYLKKDEATPEVRYGDRLQVVARLRPIHNAGNPGNFDAERYFAHRDVYWSATISRDYPLVRNAGECGNAVQMAIYVARQWLLERIAWVTAGDAYLTAMMGALLLGDNARLEDSYTENYRRTGTYHAIVISGVHITVLAGALYGLLRLLQIREFPAYAASAVVAVLYALVCDLSAPVVRASGGYLLFLGAKFFYRRARSLNLLAAVALGYLLLDPAQLFEASFQLSFLAVLTLVTLGDPVLHVTTKAWSAALRGLQNPDAPVLDREAGRRWLELKLALRTIAEVSGKSLQRLEKMTAWVMQSVIWAADLMITSAVILIGLCLPMILFFHRLTFSSLTANLPVVLLLSLAVPLGFVAIAVGPVMAPVLKGLLYGSRAVVDWHLTWDPMTRIPDPPAWVMVALPLALVLTAWCARSRPKWSPVPVVAVLALFAYVVTHPYSREPRLHKGLLEVTAIDVGQGDSLFLATPAGHMALLDGGGNRMKKFDPGESTVSPYLWSRQIAQLDTLIASHGDLDHMGGLLAAHDNFGPREIWVSEQVSGALWERLRAKAEAAGTRIRKLARGDRAKLGELEVETLWPPRDEVIAKSNLTSLVLVLRHGDKRFLLTGDIDQWVESRLVEDGLLGRVDYLKVAHHGSRYSTTTEFLDRARPAIAVASAGFENQFEHPHPTVVERLAGAHVQLLRTDRMGQITVLSDGRKLMTDIYAYRPTEVLGWIPFSQAVE